jgi:hypothetical protein
MSRFSKYISNFNNVWQEKCSNYQMMPNVLPPTDRIIVIGDIHGDMNVLLECLKKARVIGKNINSRNLDKIQWLGGNTIIVQVGDQIDSCRFDGKNSCNDPNNYKMDEADDITILYFMTNLHNIAQKHGGAVYSLIGNHELMNVRGEMSYVSHSNANKHSYRMKDGTVIQGMEARKQLFAPGNEIANFLACTRNIALIIGSNLFVHAGIVPHITNKYNVSDLNKLLKLLLLDELKNPQIFDDIFMSKKHSPLWTRIFGHIKSNEDKCDELMEPLSTIYKVGKIYVGHTPQLKTGIVSGCKGRVWLTDAGMPSAFNKFDEMYNNTNGKKKSKERQAQVLEIVNDGESINILS